MQRRPAKVINVDFSRIPREAEAGDLKGKVKTALNSLNNTSREILVDMFGLQDGTVRSIYEVSHRAGIEAAKVEEISNDALRALFFPRAGKNK